MNYFLRQIIFHHNVLNSSISLVIKSTALIVLNILSKLVLTSLNGILRTFAHLNDFNVLWPASSRIHWKRKWKPFCVTWKSKLFIETQNRSYSLPIWLSIHLKNYLDDQVHRDMINSWFSTWRLIQSGVPQVSVLGLVLFNIFIKVLEETIESRLIKFANGIKLGVPGDSLRAGLPLRVAEPGGMGWDEAYEIQFSAKPCPWESSLWQQSSLSLPGWGQLYTKGAGIWRQRGRGVHSALAAPRAAAFWAARTGAWPADQGGGYPPSAQHSVDHIQILCPVLGS